jgi:hypothetical protein
MVLNSDYAVLVFILLGISALCLAKPCFARQYNMESDSRDFTSLESGDYLELQL